MKKLVILCLTTALLLNASLYAAAPAASSGPDTVAAKVQPVIQPVGGYCGGNACNASTGRGVKSSIHGFDINILMKVAEFETLLSNKITRYVSMLAAANNYASALFKGGRVPEDTMQFLRTLHNKKDQDIVRERILGELLNLSSNNVIHLLNEIPPFLSNYENIF